MNIIENPYISIVHRNLPRLLSLYNLDVTHPLCGCGDRRYWAWKLVDFPNGTFQGAAFGLSKLLTAGMLPKGIDKVAILRRIEQMISVIPILTDHKGSLSEALPNEGSFCVTGLVLADCLGAINSLDKLIDTPRREELIMYLQPLAKFLMCQDETHGVISNHLATNALAMIRWSKTTNDAESFKRAKVWLDRIRTHTNQEGWMLEYTGADPGYQSWGTSALAQINEISPELELQDLLEKSYSFLEKFALPDGSFANGCGSRMTRFLMAGGAELQSKKSKSAARLANFARQFSRSNKFVTLDSIDELNIVPFFNDTVMAAINAQDKINETLLEPKTCSFPDAGLYIHKSKKTVITINIRRGGWISITNLWGSISTKINQGPVARSSKGHILRPVRGKLTSHTRSRMIIQSDLEPVKRILPSPLKFIILRTLSMTIFRSKILGNLVKQLLARILLLENKKTIGRVERHIFLSNGIVTDKILSGDIELIADKRGFIPSHMASQGYWQVGDDSSS